MKEKYFDSVKDAIKAFKDGRIVIVCDNENRENEGDLIFAAEKAAPEKVNFLAGNARGIICLAITKGTADRLDLTYAAAVSTALHNTAFTVSIDAKKEVTTGVSAFDRSRTILKAIEPDASPDDFAKPGHIFPLIAKEGGVLSRPGHTEAAVDLAKLSGLRPAGVICEILKEDGSMARIPDLIKLKKKFGLKMIGINDLADYRKKHEQLVRETVSVDLPSKHGSFRLVHFASTEDLDHLVLIKGRKYRTAPPLVRIHSECLTGDVFGSLRCDCGVQLNTALKMIEEDGNGILIYLRQEGRGIGLKNKLFAYKLQEEGLDTVEANIKLGFPPDLREYWIAAQIIKTLGVKKIRILTNNPEKIKDMREYGIAIDEHIPLFGEVTKENYTYLKTKKEKLKHLLNLTGA
ncbi:MAG: GTP cyclohydrolase II [Spirochaetes bacterium]|nr:GTP cyclohydrolase II [Spirochaetota bacterium]